MAPSLRMEQRASQIQTQRLIMTLQMQQSIQLLQMNSQELEQYLENELTENPFLEANAETDEAGGGEEPQAIAEAPAEIPNSVYGAEQAFEKKAEKAGVDTIETKPLD